MTNDNENRAKEDKRYSQKLIEHAKTGAEFYNWKGELVSASACQRQRDNTPLTHSEEEYFNLNEDYRDEYLRRVMEKVNKLIDKGRREYSLHTIVASIRYDSDSNGSDTFKCNDHWTPVVARILSENLDGVFLFHFRGVKGEKLTKKSQDDLEQLPAFFLKAIG